MSLHGVTATYGYDASDRAVSLSVPGQTIVSTASYEPSGPLASLALGNGITETRGFWQDAASGLNPVYNVYRWGDVLELL